MSEVAKSSNGARNRVPGIILGDERRPARSGGERRERKTTQRRNRLPALSFSLRPGMVLALLLLVQLAAVSHGKTPVFQERAEELGVVFRYRNFATGKKLMPENMGAGVVLFDANGDTRLDIYFVQGAPIVGGHQGARPKNRLFIQQPDGRFEDETAKAGVGDDGYGMGAAYGDVDGDGDLDLYVANFGPNVLYLNRGGGKFEKQPDAGGANCPLWSVSAGFFDANGDGHLDLYVVNYLDFSLDNQKWCGDARRGLRAYCHPDVYDGQPDALYFGDGKGHFTQAGREAGIPATSNDKGLGVNFADFDGNGTQDIYVANDSTMNYLLLSDGKGRFTENALLAGVGFNGQGRAEASMGTAVGDLDGDLGLDLFLTHLDEETNTLYHQEVPGLFVDATERAGLAAPSRPWVGFGVVFLDYDQDGDLDIFLTNGHIIDNIKQFDPKRAYRQPSQLFENQGSGRFVEQSGLLGIGDRLVGRGVAGGDLDGDGDIDLVITQNVGPALVLLNRLDPKRGGSILVDLRGTKSNPHGFGARLVLTSGKKKQIREGGTCYTYASQGDLALHFGLGTEKRAESLVIRWPSGQVDDHGPLKAGFRYEFTEGSQKFGRRPFKTPSR